jgi:NADP-dependent 3-hydroxy acid dehydrogenase YdfG
MPALKGLVVAITGASAGIGRACAERLGGEGACVALSARRGDRLDTVVAAIVAAGGRAIAVPGDVASPADMDALAARAIADFGRLDVMICNAGIGFHGTLIESAPDISKRLVDVNVLGTIYAAHAAAPVFMRQRSGHIIAVSSIAGARGVAGMSVYSATKAAQIAFIEALRTEFLGTGVRASVIYPVSTRTEFHDAMYRNFGHAVKGKGPKQPVDTVVSAIVSCIERPRAEVYPYWPSRWLRVLNALAPSMTDHVMRRFSRRQPHLPADVPGRS